MNGIVINIDPVIFQVGSFELRWYGMAILVAAISGIFIWVYRGKKRGIEAGDIYSLAAWSIFAGLVGARLFHVFDHFDYYTANPSQILQIQQGGLAIWGAMASGGIAAIIYARVKRIPLGPLVDAAAPALLVALMIGRIGCIINGDAYGGATDLPWGFIYNHPGAAIPESLAGLPTHPYPVYEMLWNGLVLLSIWRLQHLFKIEGTLFLTTISLYSLGRFFLTFVRQENITLWGLQQAQVLALVILIVSLVLILYLTWSRKTIQKRLENT
jgi:phosphatidylglycerol:prolipoprotein diacylglycerol transferase